MRTLLRACTWSLYVLQMKSSCFRCRMTPVDTASWPQYRCTKPAHSVGVFQHSCGADSVVRPSASAGIQASQAQSRWDAEGCVSSARDAVQLVCVPHLTA